MPRLLLLYLFVLLAGVWAGGLALLAERPGVNGLRLAGRGRLAVILVVALLLEVGPGAKLIGGGSRSDGGLLWLIGVGTGALLRWLGYAGRLDRWCHLPFVAPLASRPGTPASAPTPPTPLGSWPGAPASAPTPPTTGIPPATGRAPLARPAPPADLVPLAHAGPAAALAVPAAAAPGPGGLSGSVSAPGPAAPSGHLVAIRRPLPRAAGAELDGGAPARRAIVRWAWRLFRRAGAHGARQQLLVLGLIAVSVAATVLGAAIAINTPPPANAGFGAANHLVALPGNDPTVTADIGAIRARFGAVDVIENQSIVTGLLGGAQLRTQDPTGTFGRPMLALVSGRYPAGDGQVALTPQLASALGLHLGGAWQVVGSTWHIVGLVENPQNLLDAFGLVAPGQLPAPGSVTVLFDASAAAAGSFTFPQGAIPVSPQSSSGLSPAVIVLAIVIVGMIFIGLVSAASFTLLAQHRLRSLGMLSSLGATDAHLRLVTVANGAVAGIAGAVAGMAVGLGAWVAYAPRLAVSAHHAVSPADLPWWLIVVAPVLAIATATLAAERPARAVARIPVTAAISGRPPAPMAVYRSAVPGVIALAIGAVALASTGGWGGGNTMALLAGLVAMSAGLLLLAPFALAQLARVAGHVPIAGRIALRDLVRYRARSGAALGAASFAVLIAVVTALVATGRYADPVDYFGPNLPADQLVVYSPGAQPGAGPISAAGFDAAAAQAKAQAIAGIVGSHDVLTLDVVSAQILHPTTLGRTRTNTTRIFLATPPVLSHYGIAAGSIAPRTMMITSRSGLGGLPGLILLAEQDDVAVKDPALQVFSGLPADTSDPNLLVTEYGAQKLGLQEIPAWLIQAPRPLTQLEISTARQAAAAAGLTIEAKADNPSLDQLRNSVTAAGIAVALGVLAMTLGLIRTETAGDDRILTAVGASRRTRRWIAAATAGALGLLGAVLGTAVAYLTAGSFAGTQLVQRLSHEPWLDLALVLVGLPLAAAGGAWLLAGRGRAGIALRPLE